MKLPTSDHDALSAYYAQLAISSEVELSTMWEEISEKDWWYWLEVVFPTRTEFDGLSIVAFVTGEPTCDGVEGTVYETCVSVQGRYFRRPATYELFYHERYIDEIQKQFQLNVEQP